MEHFLFGVERLKHFFVNVRLQICIANQPEEDKQNVDVIPAGEIFADVHATGKVVDNGH